MSFETARKNWEKLAEKDPLGYVCTALHDKEQSWTEEKFFASARREIDSVFNYLTEKGFLPSAFDRALDFGCGVGRLTRALSYRFDRVEGVDVSTQMIQKANELNKHYASKISFIANPIGNLDSFNKEAYSFVYSVIALQHIPYPASLKYLQGLVSLLHHGGVLVFQVPTSKSHSVFKEWRRRMVREIRGRLALTGLTGNFFFEMNPLYETDVEATIRNAGGTILDILNTNHTDPKTYPAELNLNFTGLSSGYQSTMYVIRKF